MSPMVVNCLIVDDEPLARQKLASFVERLPGWKIAGTCANAIEAYQALQEKRVDLMFLDIKMPTLSGVDFLRSLKNPPLVVFTTAFAKYALEGHELQVLDYLLKPIPFERFLKTAERVNAYLSFATRESATPKNDHLFIKEDYKFIRIGYNEILYVEALNDYVKVCTTKQTYVANHTLKEFESMLPTSGFLRVHRSFMVSLAAITVISGNTVRVGSKEIPVGGSYRDQLMKLLG